MKPAARGSAPERRPRAWLTRALALFFAAYAMYAGWSLVYRFSLGAILLLLVCAAAAFGLWLERPWSKYFVYFISALCCGYFPWYVWILIQRGWPYDSRSGSLVALLPGALLLFFGIAMAAHVARVFRSR